MNLTRLKEPDIVVLLVIIAAIVGLDQWTKYIAEQWLEYAKPVEVLPIFNWMLLYNKGAAFSFLSNAGGWQRWLFSGISLVVSICFLVWLIRLPKAAWLTRYSLTFIVAGAIGNLIDRMFVGYVVDFISFHWQEHYFPAFNVADSSITFGAFIMILDIFVNSEKKNP